MTYGSVEWMVRRLDCEAISAERERRHRRWMRGRPESLRRFVRTVKLVVMDVSGPENLHAKKIMERLQIKATRYYELRQEAERNAV